MLQGEEDNQLIYMDFVLMVILPILFLHLWKTLKLPCHQPTRHTFLHRYISLVEFTLWSCKQQLPGSWQEHGLVRTRYMMQAQIILVLLLRSAL